MTSIRYPSQSPAYGQPQRPTFGTNQEGRPTITNNNQQNPWQIRSYQPPGGQQQQPPSPPASQPRGGYEAYAPAAQPSKDPRFQGVDWGGWLRNGGYRAPQAPAQPATRPEPPRPAPAQPTPQPSPPASGQWDGVFTTYYDWRTGLTTGSPPPPRPADAPGDVYWNAGMDPREVYKSPSAPAQPIQPPSQGTPYRPTNTQFTDAWNEAMGGFEGTPGMTVTPAYTFGGEGQGNVAYAPQENRPSPFDTWIRGFDGQQMQPDRFFNQRDDLIQRLNEESGRRAAQAGVYYDGEIPNFYQPSRDINSLMAGPMGGARNVSSTWDRLQEARDAGDLGMQSELAAGLNSLWDDPNPTAETERLRWLVLQKAKASDAMKRQQALAAERAAEEEGKKPPPIPRQPPLDPDPEVFW